MSNKSVKLPVYIADPAFCQDQSDFHKLFFGIARAECDGPEELPFFLFGIRLLLHEYLALVLRGELKPYEMSEEVKEKEMEGFRDFINHINFELTKAHVPTKEVNGKVCFDYDALNKIMEDQDGEA